MPNESHWRRCLAAFALGLAILSVQGEGLRAAEDDPRPSIRSMFVIPSVRERTLTLDVPVEGMREASAVQFVAHLLDEKGTEERRFPAEAKLSAVPAQIVRLSWRWPDPRLWDLGQPNLYTLRLQGAGLGSEVEATFGFREIRIEGRKFLLNEREVRFRPINVGAVDDVKRFVPLGFNLFEVWPSKSARSGSRHGPRRGRCPS